ncbi:MAG: tetratricopeptide repeat protein [bacterium]
MLPTRIFRCSSQVVLVTLTILTFAVAGPALAECMPGQMQEANLAYQSAVEFLNAQQWDQAIARMQSIVQVCPEHVEANRGLGTAYAGKGDFETAATHFQTVIELRGEDVEAGDFGNLGKTYAKLKMYKEARAEYMKAALLAPDDCNLLFNLGVLHSAAGYHTLSVDVFEHALDVCPQIEQNIMPQLAKAATKAEEQQRKAGNNSQAQHYHALAVKYGSQAGGSTTYQLAVQKFNERNYPEVVNILTQLLAQTPDHTGALLTMARAQDQLGNKSAAIEAYQRYVALKPNDSNNLGEMLRVMVESGQCAQAKAEAAVAAQRFESQGRENMAPIWYHWGTALECSGEYDAAKGKFEQCASSGNLRYAGPARTMIQRMDDLTAQAEYQRKKAAQGG